MKQNGESAVIFAVLLTPLVAAIFMWGLVWSQPGFDAISALGLMPLFYLFTFIPVLLIAAPLYLILERAGFFNFLSSLASGALVGIIAALVLRLPSKPHIPDLLITVPVGAVCGVSFWAIVKWWTKAG